MQSERKYADGLTALGAGLAVACLGASLVAPTGAGYIYMVVGIAGAVFGIKWLREARKQPK